MLFFRIKAFGERNKPKLIVNARLLYLTFVHGKEDSYQHHWHHFQTALRWDIFHHTGVHLDSIMFSFSFVLNSSSLSIFSKKEKPLVCIEVEKYRFENTFVRDHVTIQL